MKIAGVETKWCLSATRSILAITCIFFLLATGGCMIVKRAFAPKDPAMEEERLNTIIRETHDPDEMGDAYVSRAKLRLRADNPHINYDGALKDLKFAIALKPRLSRDRDIANWMAVLGRLAELNQEIGQLREKNESAQSQNQMLRGNVERLEKQEQELKKTIEELQSLELHREQQMRQLLR